MRFTVVVILIAITFATRQNNQDEPAPQVLTDGALAANAIRSLKSPPEAEKQAPEDRRDRAQNVEAVATILVDEDSSEADNRSEVMRVGEYIDVDAVKVDYGRQPVKIGEYIDVDAIPPDDGRAPINIGGYIGDPDEQTYLNTQYQEPVNIGEYLLPPGEYNALGEYTEPVNSGEPIYIEGDITPLP